MSQATATGDKFAWGAETVLSQCVYCKHLSTGPNPACKAFPGAIPPEILANEFDHRKPWIDPDTGQPGDQGMDLTGSITFEFAAAITPTARAALTRFLDSL